MPVIPQSSFDTNPSTRVGVHSQQVLGQSPVMGAMEATQQITGAFQALQDQQERTDAFNKANDLSKSYKKDKMLLEEALSTVDEYGYGTYIDPNDDNPDITKRARKKELISDMYKRMSDNYEEGRKSLRELNRADIADGLAEGYVRGDLMSTQLKINKAVTKAAQKGAETKFLDVIDFMSGEVLNTAVDPDSSPQAVDLKVRESLAKIDMSFQTISDVFGVEGAVSHMKYLDKSLQTLAQKVIQDSGVNTKSIKIADTINARIRDPKMKAFSQANVEKYKRISSDTTALASLQKAQQIQANVDSKPYLSDGDLLSVSKAAKNTLEMYVDPKYNTLVTKEMRDEQASNLLSSTFASRFLGDFVDDYIEENGEVTETALSLLTNPDRAPSSDGASKLREKVESYISSVGLDGMIDTHGLRDTVVNQTIEKMRNKASGDFLKENISAIISGKNPNMRREEVVLQIHKLSNVHKWGNVSYASPEEQKAFSQNFKEELNRNPLSAFQVLEGYLQPSGNNIDGSTVTRRQLMQDLTSKDPSLSYLSVAAEMPMTEVPTMLEEARFYKTNLRELEGFSTSKFEQKSDIIYKAMPSLMDVRATSAQFVEGIKQAVMHKAARMAYEDRGDKGDISKYVDQATKEISKNYASISEDRSGLMFVNTPTENYSKVSSEYAKAWIRDVRKLPQMSNEDKINLILKNAPDVAKAWKINEKSQPHHVNLVLDRMVTVKPHGRFPNEHEIHFAGAPLVNNGTAVSVSGKDMLKYINERKSQVSKIQDTSMADKW